MDISAGARRAAEPPCERPPGSVPVRWRYTLPVLLVLVLALGAALRLGAPGYTRLDLVDVESGKSLASVVLFDGAPITLTWTNSLFGLPVTEMYLARDGLLVQDAVTFGDPEDAAHNQVLPSEVEELYHTGGAFSARGLNKPFAEVVYRVSEVGNPRLRVGGETIDFKAQVGFGGRVRMTARRAPLWAALRERCRTAGS